ncbi:hypothetical protein RJ639_007471 [Escallonia herrerae]|uniref:Uncharacterized protein n=1 Tax=Escallonia herrerae TaxID=1293975 RepID=A0AA88VVQ7_9ASTE|nr:hypothetical protein RJ639_007471 [Escallonia herrerae]
MTQMGLSWWPRCTSTTSSGGDVGGSTSSVAQNNSSSRPPHLCCLFKLLTKLKKHGRMLRATGRHSSSRLQCRYDPQSYSLNFDTSGCGSLLDEDYYRFYAFSSRSSWYSESDLAVEALTSTLITQTTSKEAGLEYTELFKEGDPFASLDLWLIPAMNGGNCWSVCDLRFFFFFFKLRRGSLGWEGGRPGATNGGMVGFSSPYSKRTDCAIAETVDGSSGSGGLEGISTASRSQ